MKNKNFANWFQLFFGFAVTWVLGTEDGLSAQFAKTFFCSIFVLLWRLSGKFSSDIGECRFFSTERTWMAKSIIYRVSFSKRQGHSGEGLRLNDEIFY